MRYRYAFFTALWYVASESGRVATCCDRAEWAGLRFVHTETRRHGGG